MKKKTSNAKSMVITGVGNSYRNLKFYNYNTSSSKLLIGFCILDSKFFNPYWNYHVSFDIFSHRAKDPFLNQRFLECKYTVAIHGSNSELPIRVTFKTPTTEARL